MSSSKIIPSEKFRVMRVIARMNVGGPAVQISGLCRNLDPATFDHRLYTGFCSSDEVDYLEARATDVKAYRVPTLGRRIGLFADLQAILYLRREIKTFAPHVIHSHTAKAGVIARLAYLTVRHHSKIVHTFHGHILKGYYGKLVTKLIILLETLLAFFTDKIFAVGGIVQNELIEAGIGNPSKFVLMPPGLELGPLKSQADARRQLNLPEVGLICGYIVRVTQVKRPDRFLDVVRQSVKQQLGLSFVVAGDGDLLESIRNTAEQEELPIVFLGMVSQIELVFSAIDMVVMTSDNEGMPLTLIQAGLAKLPSVTTDVGSSRHVVIHEQTGFVTESPTDTEITDGLKKLLLDSQLRRTMGEAAFSHCKERFSVTRLTADHSREYLKLLISD
jgi:glycosyltransferase involved in cell wall biosynthesis